MVIKIIIFSAYRMPHVFVWINFMIIYFLKKYKRKSNVVNLLMCYFIGVHLHTYYSFFFIFLLLLLLSLCVLARSKTTFCRLWRLRYFTIVSHFVRTVARVSSCRRSPIDLSWLGRPSACTWCCFGVSWFALESICHVVKVVKGSSFCWYVVVHAQCVSKHAPSRFSYGGFKLHLITFFLEVVVRDLTRLVDPDYSSQGSSATSFKFG